MRTEQATTADEAAPLSAGAPAPASSGGHDARFREVFVAIRLMAREVTVVGRLRRLAELAPRLADGSVAAVALNQGDGSVLRFLTSSSRTADLLALHAALRAHGVVDADTLLLGADPDDGAASSAGVAAPAPLLIVPLRNDVGAVGTLYVLGRAETAFDELSVELVHQFAETASQAASHAANLEESRQRQHWLTAAADISRQLLSATGDETEVWREIATNVKYLSDARTVTVCVQSEDDPDDIVVHVASGVGARDLEGRHYPREGSLADLVLRTGETQLVRPDHLFVVHRDVEPSIGLGQVLALPMRGGDGEIRGAIVISRPADQPDFSVSDVRMADNFATQAGLALEFAEARSAQHTLEAQSDRERITETLQDQVVQRLFSVGLSLQAISEEALSSADAIRLRRAVLEIDETIREVRASLDPVGRPEQPSSFVTFRTALVLLLEDLEPLLGFVPEVAFTGPLDTRLVPELADAVLVQVREALVDVATTAGAARARVEVNALPEAVEVVVTDDGAGFVQRGASLARAWQDAEAHGIPLQVERPDGGGLRLRWLLRLAAASEQG